jgi:hypothetical protein
MAAEQKITMRPFVLGALIGRQQQCGGQKSQVKKTNDAQKEGASEGVLYRW